MKTNFFIPLVALVTGILCSCFGAPFWTGISSILLSLISYFVLLFLSHNPIVSVRMALYHFIWFFFLFLGIGIMLTDLKACPNPSVIEGFENISCVRGKVIKVSTLSSGDNLLLEVNEIKDKKKGDFFIRNFYIHVFPDGKIFQPGDEIIIRNPEHFSSSKNRKLSRFIAPASNPVFYLTTASDNVKILKEGGKDFIFLPEHIRDRIIIKIENSSLNRPTAEFLISILLGDKEFLSSSVKESFNAAGISHVLALSGMHVGIISVMFLGLFFPFKIFGFRKTTYFLTLICIWLYAFLTGCEPSTLRACIMTSFVFSSILLQRKKSMLNALFCSLVIILIINPFSLFDIGLQLSFICVASLILLVEPLNRVDRHDHHLLYNLNSIFLVSIISTLSSWALISFYFKRIPLLFLPVNVLILPFFPIYLGIASVYLILLSFGIDFSFLAICLDKGYGLFISFCKYIESFRPANIVYQVDNIIVLTWLLFWFIFSWIIYKNKGYKRLAYVSSILILLLFVTPFFGSKPAPSLVINKDYYAIGLTHKSEREEKDIKFLPRNTYSTYSSGLYLIHSLDCPLTPEIINSMYEKIKDKELSHILIVGSGAKDFELSDNTLFYNFDSLVIHSSFRKEKEKELISKALSLGFDVHSLRFDGELELSL